METPSPSPPPIPPAQPTIAGSPIRSNGNVGVRIAIWGIVTLSVIGLIVFVAFTLSHGKQYDKESKEFANSSLKAILKSWDPAELEKRADDKFYHFSSKEKTNEFLKKMSVSLGQLKEYKEAQGEAKLVFTSLYGTVITARYVSNSAFEKGNARVTLMLSYKNGAWKIFGIHVDSAQSSK